MTRIVSISSLKGGVGKTSLVLGLASAAQAAGLNTLVIDLDPHGDASTGLGVEAKGLDMGVLLQNPDSYQLADHLLPSSWLALEADQQEETEEQQQTGVWVGRASSSLLALEQLAPDQDLLPRLAQLLEPVASDFDLILIDCPPVLGALTQMAWAASERVLSVAEPSLFSVAGSERTLRAIARFEAQSSYAVHSASIVINKMRAGDPEHDYRVEEMSLLFGDLLAPVQIPETPLMQRIQGSAYPVHYWPEPQAQPLAQVFSQLLEGLLAEETAEDEQALSQEDAA